MRTLRVAPILAAIVLFACAPRAGFAQTAPKPTTGLLSSTSYLPSTFSFEVWDGLIVVKVNVGDGLPANAIIATGLPLCFASPSFASSRALGADGLRDVDILDRS